MRVNIDSYSTSLYRDLKTILKRDEIESVAKKLISICNTEWQVEYERLKSDAKKLTVKRYNSTGKLIESSAWDDADGTVL